MRNLFNSIFAVAVIAILASCGAQPEGEKVDAQDAIEKTESTVEATAYAVDVANSVISWEGKKTVGNDGHVGIMNITDGTLEVADGNITGGTFTIDVSSISTTDFADNPKKKAKLEGHLKAGDFLDVANFPTGTFTVVKATPIEGATANENGFVPTHEVTGNLMLKDVTKSISFKVAVEMGENSVSAKSDPFVIDRTQWGIDHNNIKDIGINDNLGISISIVAGEQVSAKEETE